MINRNLLILLTALATFTAILHLVYLWPVVGSPSDTTIPESQTVYIAHQIAQGHDLYPDFHRYPYNIAPYTPGYYLLLGYFSRIVDADPERIFLIGRGISYVCVIGVAFILYLFGTSQTRNRWIGWIAASLFTASYVLWPWAVSSRCDLLALLFTSLGFFFYLSRPAASGVIVSAIFFLLAFFTKQSYLMAPAAVLLDSLLRKRRQDAMRFAALTIVPAVMVMAIMHGSTGSLSTLNIVYGNVAPLRLSTSRILFTQFLQFAPLPVVLAAAGWKAAWAKESPLNRSATLLRALSIYWILSLLWALLASSKIGSNINYFIEPLFASCMLVPMGIQVLVQNLTFKTRPVLAAMFFVLLIPPINFLLSSKASFHPSPRILQLVKSAEGPILTDNSRFAFYGRDSFMIDPFQLSFLEESGNWTSDEIIRMIEAGQIRWIIVRNPLDRSLSWQGVTRIPQRITDIAKSRYILHTMLDGYYVYSPDQK